MKGEAQMLGFAEIGRLSERLEDVLFAVRARGYRVPEEVNIVVIMALQLTARLLKRKAGTRPRGLDLDGFLREMEEVLFDFDEKPSDAQRLTVLASPELRPPDANPQLGMTARSRLASVATTLYLEHLRASGASSRRLLESWRVLAREIALHEAVPLEADLSRHAAAARDLARELDKEVEVALDVDDGVRAAAEVLDALNTVVLHAVRNAVDHGIEAPLQRSARGKPPAGRLRLWARQHEDWVALRIEDDGDGVDVERVRRRAIEQGYLGEAAAATASTGDLLALVFRFGFSTREAAGDVSGRGVGLDAARSAVERFGGSIAIDSEAGRGTTLTVQVPNVPRTLDVHVVPAYGSSVLLAVPATCEVSPSTVVPAGAIDPLVLLDLPRSAAGGEPCSVRVRDGARQVHLLVGGLPRQDVAARLCPSKGESIGIEIVRCAAGEAILVHPSARLAAPA
jgi:chemotaxis protein histidine kinase CheA